MNEGRKERVEMNFNEFPVTAIRRNEGSYRCGHSQNLSPKAPGTLGSALAIFSSPSLSLSVYLSESQIQDPSSPLSPQRVDLSSIVTFSGQSSWVSFPI